MVEPVLLARTIAENLQWLSSCRLGLAGSSDPTIDCVNDRILVGPEKGCVLGGAHRVSDHPTARWIDHYGWGKEGSGLFNQVAALVWRQKPGNQAYARAFAQLFAVQLS